jgi:hypothetical protein
MSSDKILDAALTAFKQTFTQFCRQHPDAANEALSPTAMSVMTKGLMAAAASAGQNGLAAYLEAHDTDQSVVVVDDVRYRYKNKVEKNFLTLFGNVVVNRSVYGNDLVGGYVAPLDRALGIGKDESATVDAREMILFAVSSCTPQEVAALLGKASLCQPSRSAIQSIIVRDGARMEQQRGTIARKVGESQPIPQDAQVLVASMDGANVRLREPGAKKGRKPQRPRDSAQDEGSSRSSFRNAMVGSFSWYGRDDQGQTLRLGSSYLARMPQDKAPVFKEEFERRVLDITTEAAAAGRDIDKVLLCDGHRAIWNYAEHNDLLSDFQWCVDFYHTSEHLSKAAEAIFGAKSARGRWWYNRWRDELKRDADAPTSIIRSISGYMKRFRLPKTRREALNSELTFFKRNRYLMRYPEFINKGYPIGSGPVEAAAKTIVKQRMCRSGMRWNRNTGQHVLTLRSYAKSKTWDQMWSAYTELRMAA